MRKEEPIIFKQDGITYRYHYYVETYDGNTPSNWEDCAWQPEEIKGEKCQKND